MPKWSGYGRLYDGMNLRDQKEPDKFIVLTIIANEKKASVEWIWNGRYPKTNEEFNIKGVSIMLIKDGLIVENKDYWDWNTLSLRTNGGR